MTQEELKKKIDGIFLGLHSTNPGDINAIKDILNAIADAAGGGGAPVIIEGNGPCDYNINIQLLRLLESGTAISNVVANIRVGAGEVQTILVTVIKAGGEPPQVTFYPTLNFHLEYTETQYEGLRAIQREIDDYTNTVTLRAGRYPAGAEEGPFYLLDDDAEMFICVDDKLLLVTSDEDGAIESLEISNISTEGDTENAFASISWEDAQKLIGIYLI